MQYPYMLSWECELCDYRVHDQTEEEHFASEIHQSLLPYEEAFRQRREAEEQRRILDEKYRKIIEEDEKDCKMDESLRQKREIRKQRMDHFKMIVESIKYQ